MAIDSYSAAYRHLTEGGTRVENALVARRRDEVIRSISRHPHRTVLEIGCGLDPLFAHYHDFTTHVIVEPVPEFAEHARQLAAGRSGVEVITGFVQSSLAEVARDYDMIIASGVLHEVQDARELLDVIAKLCSAHTVVHVNVPNMRSFHRLLAKEMGLIREEFEPSDLDRKLGHAAWFDKDRLVALARAAGFETIADGTYYVKPLTHGQLEAAIAQGIVDAEILHGLAKMTKYMPELGAELFVELRRAN